MSTLIFDIETIPLDFETSFDEVQRDYLLRGAVTEEEREQRKGWGGLNPLTGKVVCIGTLVHETLKGSALYLAQEESDEIVERDGMKIRYKAFVDESALLQHFWNGLSEKYSGVVTFNGRNFDCPFLMLRSAVLGIRPSVNMMAGTRWEFKVGGSASDRYSGIEHIDLQDKLCFGQGFDKAGATRKFNLDFYTKSFGIASPKSEGIAGDKVPLFFSEGRHREIAEYCMRDVKATGELYEMWRTMLKY
ncbi:MAG: ribonuclease H-like domain-containing protein [Bacteroidota bacterium]|nr:ribonuclease H-like domain-containing protein [Bacteroidota bacterium]MDP4233057.1 ribonuclease H-like domain-containing protein [Bacteroidota bacterium]MDP4241798.1 ribonuclease H-like domain-containing protein [Bacteroidota bacterium]MDP4288781.1 ribonuclease H-like domain-containing protein [Bacteroidota bacterium]